MIEAKNVSFPFVMNAYATFKDGGNEYSTVQFLYPVTSRTVWHSLFWDFIADLIMARLPEKYAVKNLKSEGMLRFSFDILNPHGSQLGWWYVTVYAEDILVAKMLNLEDQMRKFIESKNNAAKPR